MAHRTIDSEIFIDEDFGELPPKIRLLQLGIMTLVNDVGELRANPRRLSSQIFFNDDLLPEEIQDYLDVLNSKKFIELYQEDDKTYLRLNEKWLGKRLGAIDKEAYGYNWKALSHMTRERDGHCCTKCGKTKCRLNAHHIIDVGKGGLNELDNLITLCSSCHRKAHKKSKGKG